MKLMRHFQPVALLSTLLLPSVLDAQIFADFDTSMGEFTCQLRYEESPKAVANFIGLAEGSRKWIDPASGAVRNGVPYYAGVRFHRVVEGFMNQTGSRNGLGNDGPGYVFKDEVSNGLSHDAAGILSMANSGRHRNGAQIFVTAAAATFLDGKHTIFGFVTSGIEVVHEINSVPKSLSSSNELSVPVTPVVLNSVTIRRVGAEAEAFDVDAQTLPEISGVAGRLEVDPGVAATFVREAMQAPGSVFTWYSSPDLVTWAKVEQVYEDARAAGSSVARLDDAPNSKAFYQLSEVRYSDGVIGPDHTVNQDLTVLWGSHNLQFQIDSTGFGGTGTLNDVPFLILDAWLDQSNFSPHQPVWIIQTNNYGYLKIEGVFDALNGSNFQGYHDLFQYNGAPSNPWTAIGTGSLTVVQP